MHMFDCSRRQLLDLDVSHNNHVILILLIEGPPSPLTPDEYPTPFFLSFFLYNIYSLNSPSLFHLLLSLILSKASATFTACLSLKLS